MNETRCSSSLKYIPSTASWQKTSTITNPDAPDTMMVVKDSMFWSSTGNFNNFFLFNDADLTVFMAQLDNI